MGKLIDWNKPIQIMIDGVWRDVGVWRDAQAGIRNKPEPLHYRWLNVCKASPLREYKTFWANTEYDARRCKDPIGYIYTLRVNLETGETERVYL